MAKVTTGEKKGNVLYVDMSELERVISSLSSNMSVEQMRTRLYWVVEHAARKSKQIVGNDVPIVYHTNKKTARAAVGRHKMQRGNNITATVPVIDPKYTIGGKHIKAYGGVYGWASLQYAGRGYKLRAAIEKNKKSELPYHMPASRGGNPPFRNVGANKLNDAVYTRTGKKRFPIRHVTALSTGQMVVNKSSDSITDDIAQVLSTEFDKYIIMPMFKNI